MDIRTTLYHKSRSGAIHSWGVAIEGNTIISTHGQVDGQKIVSKKVATGKNIGRSNETTPEQQALIEAQAMWTFKRERKYSLTPEEAQEDVLLPMLAQPFEKRESKLTYPLDVQPKLDGVRALAKWEGDKVVLISRSGKPWLVTTHLNEQLERIMPKGTVLDGEIYLHGKGFQWITARTKKRQEGTEQLQYHVYDMPETEVSDSDPWEDRKHYLAGLLNGIPQTERPHIIMVGTSDADNKARLLKVHDGFVSIGYEGLIVRTLDGVYEYGHRSPGLLKVKAFQDAEYEIVGHTDGVGVEKGLVIWTCSDPKSGKTFDTRPRGTHDERRHLFNEAEKYYGSALKVRYFGLTDEGLPRFPIGVGIRAEEDI